MSNVEKCRGLRKDGNGWAFGYYLYVEYGNHRIYTSDGHYNEVYPETVGQRVSDIKVLHQSDPLGKSKLYEGDSVDFFKSPYCVDFFGSGVIEFYKFEWGIRTDAGTFIKLSDFEDVETQIEIVGTIHDKVRGVKE